MEKYDTSHAYNTDQRFGNIQSGEGIGAVNPISHVLRAWREREQRRSDTVDFEGSGQMSSGEGRDRIGAEGERRQGGIADERFREALESVLCIESSSHSSKLVCIARGQRFNTIYCAWEYLAGQSLPSSGGRGVSSRVAFPRNRSAIPGHDHSEQQRTRVIFTLWLLK